jgi:hypothetical protein
LRKLIRYGAAVVVPVLLALGIWLGFAVSEAYRNVHFLKGFEQIIYRKSPLTVAQVEALMGPPASIEQSETADQTVTGMVYHYPSHGADLKVVFVNGVVFHAEMPATLSP